MKHTNYWLICSILLLIQACQTQQRDENASTEEINQNIEESGKYTDNQLDISLEGRVFVYGLGCHWDSQSLTTGKLSFYEGGRFKFALRRDLKKGEEQDDFPDRFEVLEGKYTSLTNQGEVKFTFDKYSSKNIQLPEEFIEANFQDESIPVSQLTARIDSCENKIRLTFDPSDALIPQEKYFNWVEKNHSGTYISYAEGVREELIIEGIGENISISYHSPSYQKPVALEVKANPSTYIQSDYYKVNFPSDKNKIYHVILFEGMLQSNSQEFYKLTNKYIDNPGNLLLSQIDRAQVLESALNSPPNLDTIIPYINSKKIKISEASQEEFEQYFQDIEFNLLHKKQCDNPNQANNCDQEIEAKLLAKNPDVRREGKILIFQLDDNKQGFLKSHDLFGHPQHFTYHGYVNSPYGKLSYTIGSFYEWGNYLLMHHQSGAKIAVNGTPFFSPDNKYFINSRSFHIWNGNGTDFQLWAIKPHGFELIWEYSTDFMSTQFAWIDQNTLVFDVIRFGEMHDYQVLKYGKMEIID